MENTGKMELRATTISRAALVAFDGWLTLTLGERYEPADLTADADDWALTFTATTDAFELVDLTVFAANNGISLGGTFEPIRANVALMLLQDELARIEYGRKNFRKAQGQLKRQRKEYKAALKTALAEGRDEAAEQYAAWIAQLDRKAAVELDDRELITKQVAANTLARALDTTVSVAPFKPSVPVTGDTRSVEATITAPNRDAAEAAMFFLVDVLGEDEFVGLADNTVYFGTNITADALAKIRKYIKAHGLKATFAA